jgi:hypothetical protein
MGEVERMMQLLPRFLAQLQYKDRERTMAAYAP